MNERPTDSVTRPPGAARSCGIGTALLLGALALAPSAAHAQTADEAAAACAEAVRLIGERDVDGALEEAEWCVESLRQVRQQRTLAAFPDTLEGFTGGQLDNQSAMGMTMLERGYTGEEGTIEVSLATGAAGSGLAAIAQMGMSLGGAGGRKLRVQRRTVVDMSAEEGEARYLVQLKSGGMLTISSPTLSADRVLEFVRAFPIAELDEALAP